MAPPPLGMVVCPHALASQVGADILRRGGAATDAAIAIQAALSVVYPPMTGLGGDAFWLFYDSEQQQVQGLNGSGRSAQAATIQAYRDRGFDTIPQRGPLAALTVPGAVDSWHQAHQRYGILPWEDLFQGAIALAMTGYPATVSQVHWTRRDYRHFLAHSPSDCPFLPQGKVPVPGQTLTNPDLAQTLQTLARDGAADFYQGSLAARIVSYLGDVGGLITAADLAQHCSDWVAPISTSYRGYDVYTVPPNSQGFALLQALNIVAGVDVAALGHGTADYYHVMVEATKLAFADRDRWLTDPAFGEIPLADLISRDYGDRQRQRLNWQRAGTYEASAIGGDTVYTAVVDSRGNAVSVIQSVYFDFGSAVVVPGTGFVLQNRGCFFDLNPATANCLAPAKRTFHTLMPSLVLQGNRPHLVLGTMGGEGQPQTLLALLTRVLDFAMDPQAAIDAPRWLWGRTWGDTTTGLTLEGRIPAAVQTDLGQRGHPVQSAPDWTATMGHAHLIRIDPTTGLREGGCDRRSDGTAIAVS